MPTSRVEIAFTTAPNDPAPVYVDVTSYLLHGAALGIDKWRADEQSTCDRNSCGFTLNNSDGRFTPGLATGAHYPNVKKGRRVRQSSLVPGNLCTNPSFETNTTDWAGTNCTIARTTAQFHTGAASLELTATGTSNMFAATPTGLSATPVTTGFAYSLQGRFRAATVVQSCSMQLLWYNSAGTFLSSNTGTGVANTTTGWTQATVTATAPANAAFVSIRANVLSPDAAGEIHYLDSVMLEHGSTVSPVANGNTTGWEWEGTANNSVSLKPVERFNGYIDDWLVTWPGVVSSFATCAVTASSRMARLGAGSELKSIVEEEILVDGPTYYATMGEPAGSTQANDSSGNNHPPLTMAGTGTAVVFGTATGPGTDGLTAATFSNVVQSGKYLQAPLSTAGSVSVEVECFATSAPSDTNIGLVELTGSSGDWLQLEVLAGGEIYVRLNGSGTIIDVVGGSGLDDGTVRHFAARATLAAGTITLTLYQDGVSLGSSSNAYASFPDFTTLAVGVISEDITAGAELGSIAHAAVFAGATELSATRILAHANAGLTGFVNETPAARLARYASFAGVPAAETSFETGDVPNLAHIDTTGKTALTVMREVETTEGGVLFDAADGTLKFHDRSHRYAQSSAFTIALSDGVVTVPLAPILDDQQVVNDLTATGSTGITARVTDQDSIDVDPGELHRDSLDLATSNADEPLMAASWRVGRYAQPMVRVPEVTIHLNKCSDALVDLILRAEVGTKFTLTGLPANAPASSMVLFVEGMSEHIDAIEHTITFRTSAAEVFDVWILGDATYGVLGTTTRLAL